MVLVIGIEIDVFAKRQQAACIEACATPFGILVGVEQLDASIRPWMIGVNCEAAFRRQSIAVAPVEIALRPIQIYAVLVRS